LQHARGPARPELYNYRRFANRKTFLPLTRHWRHLVALKKPGFHIPTYFVILSALFIAIILTVDRGVNHETVFYLLIAIATVLLAFYVRHFAVRNQDRLFAQKKILEAIALPVKLWIHACTKAS
jgi:hypothetical protein